MLVIKKTLTNFSFVIVAVRFPGPWNFQPTCIVQIRLVLNIAKIARRASRLNFAYGYCFIVMEIVRLVKSVIICPAKSQCCSACHKRNNGCQPLSSKPHREQTTVLAKLSRLNHIRFHEVIILLGKNAFSWRKIASFTNCGFVKTMSVIRTVQKINCNRPTFFQRNNCNRSTF